MTKKDPSMRRLDKHCHEVCALLKALSHPGRLLILGYLGQGEKTVSELQELCGLSQSQLSQFLSRMKLEKLVTCSRRGRFVYYTPADVRVGRLIQNIQKLYCDS